MVEGLMSMIRDVLGVASRHARRRERWRGTPFPPIFIGAVVTPSGLRARRRGI
jgi:hypothetical protein